MYQCTKNHKSLPWKKWIHLIVLNNSSSMQPHDILCFDLPFLDSLFCSDCARFSLFFPHKHAVKTAVVKCCKGLFKEMSPVSNLVLTAANIESILNISRKRSEFPWQHSKMSNIFCRTCMVCFSSILHMLGKKKKESIATGIRRFKCVPVAQPLGWVKPREEKNGLAASNLCCLCWPPTCEILPNTTE